jgi:tetrapyrrole methylase family protein/MazG family protein
MDELERAWETIVRLRSKDGCPWDRKQTSDTLKFSLIEESYEVLESIDERDDDRLREELGDVLLLVFMHACIARDEGRFSIEEVARSLREKMVRRHPHVFGERKFEDQTDLLEFWESTKDSRFGGLSLRLPALYLAQKVGERARRAGFDPDGPDLGKGEARDWFGELLESFERTDRAGVEERFGDLLFALANLARRLDLEAEDLLRSATKRFIRRFERMEEAVRARGKSIEDMRFQDMNEMWDDVKESPNDGT